MTAAKPTHWFAVKQVLARSIAQRERARVLSATGYGAPGRHLRVEGREAAALAVGRRMKRCGLIVGAANEASR
jgi:hypothetical protein